MKERNWTEVSYGYLKRRIRLGKKRAQPTAGQKKRAQPTAGKKKKSTANSKPKKRAQPTAGKKKSTANCRQQQAQLERVVSKSLRNLVKVAQKLEIVVQLVLSWVSIHLHGGRRSCRVWRASLFEVRQRGAYALNCSVTEYNGFSERKLSSTRSTQHVCVRN